MRRAYNAPLSHWQRIAARSMFVGVDTGGTFTDFFVVDEVDGRPRVRSHKVLSTPAAPEEAVLQGLRDLAVDPRQVQRLVHGTTVATNAALEGRGARTAYVADRGLGDVLTLGRQDRRELYALTPAPQTPPVPEDLCLEVDARLGADGEAVVPLREESIEALLAKLRSVEPEAVALNLLFSWRTPAHERRLAEAIADALPGLTVSCSSEVLPRLGEYERGIATWLNARLGPLVSGYLARLRAGTSPAPLAVMQSSGGTIDAAQAGRRAVDLLLSGPAGGVAAARGIAARAGIDRMLTFDMGGTSTDVALVEGHPTLTTQARIGPWPVAVPMLDLHTIGAGGGSLARLDAGGALAVGPASAGADPGPACYGRGGSTATVTDAHVVLGRLPADTGFGGSFRPDVAAARRALEGLAATLGYVGDDAPERAALGVLRLANDHMARALRAISVDRGVDPRGAVLCCFGGAGGLHICALAEELSMDRALVPSHGGVLSALGMLLARPARTRTRSLDVALADLPDTAASLGEAFAALEATARDELVAEGHARAQLESRRTVALRYAGQSFSLELSVEDGEERARSAVAGSALEGSALEGSALAGSALAASALAERFAQDHETRNGHRLDAPVIVDSLRVDVTAPPPTLPALDHAPTAAAAPGRTTVHGIPEPVPVRDRAQLAVGERFEGPLVVAETTATTWIAAGWAGHVDDAGNLVLERGGP